MAGKRIMIINWKWEDLDPETEPVDAGFPVRNDPHASIIRLNEFQSPEALIRLVELIRQQQREDQILLFLHRDHHYTHEHIRQIYGRLDPQELQRCKCFLFGGGNDYLYFSSREEGLLDDFGWWMNEPEYEYRGNGKGEEPRVGSARVVVHDEKTDRWEVLPRYFQKVWQFYQQEMQRKVFELKQDLLAELLPAYLDHASPHGPLTALVRARLENFCGQLSTEGLQMLAKYEREQERTFIFGTESEDVAKQLGERARTNYTTLQDLLKKTLTADSAQGWNNQIPVIRTTFDKLLADI